MKFTAYIIFIIGSIAITACNEKTERLEAILKYSGQNRGELEKVLAHYSKNPADSLKLESAVFLIENMPGHYSFTSPFLEQYYAKLDSVKDVPYHEKKLFQQIPFGREPYSNDMKILEDVKCIKADFLIHNIELAFRQWQTLPWLEGVDFDTFKEYLLPYRIDHEQLDYWRDSSACFQDNLNDYITYHDDCRYSPTYMANMFSANIYSLNKKIPELDFLDFELSCIPLSKLQLSINRIIGIPSAIDFIPHYANRNGRHYWSIVIEPNLNSFRIFQANIYRAAKIYRRTFSHNPVCTPQAGEYIPPFFRDPFNKDVTALYLPTTNLTINIPRNIKINHAYLAVFNDLSWKPIASDKPAGKQACFSDLGKDVVYLPVYYNKDEEMCPLASPVAIYSNGRRKDLQVNKDSVQKMILDRKYPNNSGHGYWVDGLINSRFEAANQEDFRDADTIFSITKKIELKHQCIYPDSTLKKRYWRFIHSKEQICNLAELHFYDNKNQQLKGKLIGLDSTKAQGILDNDPLTIGYVEEWIGMDFGQPVSVSKIRYLPRNDANDIYPGDDYELFYYDFPAGWVSMGVKTASGYELEYAQVPAGGLYWLRNLTAGQEERIFTWEKGKARFW